MEDDPNKKDPNGKRIVKKVTRRNSKSSNSSQNSVHSKSRTSRLKSFENKRLSVEINDNSPLPTPDGTTGKVEHTHNAPGLKIEDKKPRVQDAYRKENKLKKIVDINENFNTIDEESSLPSASCRKELPRPGGSADIGTSKKTLKRKLEEESGAGTSGASAGASDTDADDKDSKDKKKKNRCAVCRKKVGLTGFECRCGGLFCAVHRYSDKHECSFDYRELGAQEIRRNNPVVVSQKIHKI